jgi:hypothetical protein
MRLNQIVVGHVDQLQGVPQTKGAQQRGAVGSWREVEVLALIALARGINGTRAIPCTICIVLVRATGQAGHPDCGAWILLRVRRRTVRA